MKGSSTKEEVPQKFVARIEYEHKICKVKKISLPIGNKAQAMPSTFDEAKATCKARKRKERQESVNSLCQERKVIRSNSEERPIPTKSTDSKNNIRRVSSSGDFPKSVTDEKIHSSPNRMSGNDKTLTYDDHEHEKRRSHERFARPHTLKSRKYPNKQRFKIRYSSKAKVKSEPQNDRDVPKRSSCPPHAPGIHHNQHNNNNDAKERDGGADDSSRSTGFLNLRPADVERSPSPVHTPVSPVLDFSTLHEQVDCSEPVLSRPSHQLTDNTDTLPSLSVASNRMLSSPRNSIIATHRIYLDPDVPQTNVSLEKNPIDERIERLNRHISSHKKKIKMCEADFEAKRGFKPSQLDKLNDGIMRKLYEELSKYKKEQKQLSEISVSCSLMNFNGKLMQGGRPVSLQETVDEIEENLMQKRESARRDFDLEIMSSEELLEEKVAMQKALLFLESIHGRPQNKADRDIVRPFYDRYRILKRMVSKISNAGTGGELATILENETMHFVTPTSSSNDTESEKTENIKPPPPLPSASSTDSDADASFSENLHSLSKPELLRQLKIVTEEKKELRRTIKEFELNVATKTGRMLTKEDKEPMKKIYAAYKIAKGRLRLLEALVGKQKSVSAEGFK